MANKTPKKGLNITNEDVIKYLETCEKDDDDHDDFYETIQHSIYFITLYDKIRHDRERKIKVFTLYEESLIDYCMDLNKEQRNKLKSCIPEWIEYTSGFFFTALGKQTNGIPSSDCIEFHD